MTTVASSLALFFASRQVKDLRKSCSDAEASREAAESQLSVVQARISKLEGSIKELEELRTEREGLITKMERASIQLEGAMCVCVCVFVCVCVTLRAQHASQFTCVFAEKEKENINLRDGLAKAKAVESRLRDKAEKATSALGDQRLIQAQCKELIVMQKRLADLDEAKASVDETSALNQQLLRDKKRLLRANEKLEAQVKELKKNLATQVEIKVALSNLSALQFKDEELRRLKTDNDWMSTRERLYQRQKRSCEKLKTELQSSKDMVSPTPLAPPPPSSCTCACARLIM